VRTHARPFGNTAEGTRTVNDLGPIPKLRTPGVLAADLGEPLHRVLYVLRTRRHIRPTANAGRLRLYDRDAVELLWQELMTIDARRTKGVARDK
jgi:hypothetical protein